jgi:hypothetical protein
MKQIHFNTKHESTLPMEIRVCAEESKHALQALACTTSFDMGLTSGAGLKSVFLK